MEAEAQHSMSPGYEASNVHRPGVLVVSTHVPRLEAWRRAVDAAETCAQFDPLLESHILHTPAPLPESDGAGLDVITPAADLSQPRFGFADDAQQARSRVAQALQDGEPYALVVLDAEDAAAAWELAGCFRALDPLLQLLLVGGDTRPADRSADGPTVFWQPDGSELAGRDLRQLAEILVQKWAGERHLRRTQARLATAERVADCGHWEWSPRGDRARWCNQFARIFDLPPAARAGSAEAIWGRVHPEDRLRLRLELGRAAHEQGSRSVQYRLQLADGAVRHVMQESLTTIGARDGAPWTMASVRDVTEHRGVEESLHKLAYFDALTELPNRSFLSEYLNHALHHARRHGRTAAILHVDLDGFKWVNETLGNGAGDLVLKEMAHRLEGCIRESDCVARSDTDTGLPGHLGKSADTVTRFGADEFIVVLTEVNDTEDADCVAERICNSLQKPLSLDGRSISVTASIGIAVFPSHAEGEDQLLRNARLAMELAKREGRNTWRMYDHSMQRRPRVDRLSLESKLRAALDDQRLLLYYQPKIRLSDGALAGAEALLRWPDPELGMIPPSEFIPIAEETGMIRELGFWVMETACQQIAHWSSKGERVVPISVNVSASQLKDSSLAHRLGRLIESHGVAPASFEVEITESVLMEESEINESRLRDIRALGCAVSLDDFGTGYSSLSYLRRLPIDIVKIDRSFVRDILEEPDDQAILRAIIAMAHQLRLAIVAEGVETREQLALLGSMQCDLIQGYVESPPLSCEDFRSRYLGPIRREAVAACCQERRAS